MIDAGLDRLVHGVLWPGFRGTSAPDWLRRARDAGLAGAVLFASNVAAGARPIEPGDGFLVGIDEEGGSVTRVEAGTGSTLPSAAQLGRLDDAETTRAVGRSIAALAATAGANVVAYPVADVNVEPANPVIGTRAFGAAADLVARHVAAAVAGVTDAGLAACAKHFPGHGDTVVDTHHGVAVTQADADAMASVHLPPFAAAIAAGTPMIMTGHVIVPAWDEAPATLSLEATSRLRSMGFDGVVVTDALDMDAVHRLGRGTAVVAALAAGCDLLCLGSLDNPGAPADDAEPYAESVRAIHDAVADGTLSIARLEQAAGRVDALRARLASATPPPPFDAEAALELADRVVRRAAQTTGTVAAAPPRLVLDARAAATWATSRTGLRMAEPLAAGGAVVVAGSPEQAAAAARGTAASIVVLVDRLADDHQRAVCDAVAAVAPHAVVVDLGVAPTAETALATLRLFGTGRATAAAAAALLRG